MGVANREYLGSLPIFMEKSRLFEINMGKGNRLPAFQILGIKAVAAAFLTIVGGIWRGDTEIKN